MSFKKNTAVTGFPFALVSATDGSPITTGTVTGYVTLDGGTQATIAGSATHEGNGQWSINLTAGEMNGDIVGLLFTHASAINVHFTIKTDTKIVSDLNDLSTAQVKTQVDTALTDIHLDHLFAVDYDPTSKPGNAGAWANEMVENNGSGGVRYTVDALSQAPGGGGSDWSTAEKNQIRSALGVDGTKVTATGGQLQDKSEFNPATDAVANVTLVDTTTTNTDMRGTDSAYTGTPPTATENADALLNRDMSAVSDTNSRSPLNALRTIRNKAEVVGSTLTVFKENDTTAAYTAAVTSDANADPITGIDPA